MLLYGIIDHFLIASQDNITAVVIDLRRYVTRVNQSSHDERGLPRSDLNAARAYATPRPVFKPNTTPSTVHTTPTPPTPPPRNFNGLAAPTHSTYRAVRRDGAARSSKSAGQSNGVVITPRKRHSAPISATDSPLTLQEKQSVLVADGNSQRVFSLRSMIPRHNSASRSKGEAHKPRLEQSMPLVASSNRPRPQSSAQTLLGKKKALLQNQKVSSHIPHRSELKGYSL